MVRLVISAQSQVIDPTSSQSGASKFSSFDLTQAPNPILPADQKVVVVSKVFFESSRLLGSFSIDDPDNEWVGRVGGFNVITIDDKFADRVEGAQKKIQEVAQEVLTNGNLEALLDQEFLDHCEFFDSDVFGEILSEMKASTFEACLEMLEQRRDASLDRILERYRSTSLQEREESASRYQEKSISLKKEMEENLRKELGKEPSEDEVATAMNQHPQFKAQYNLREHLVHRIQRQITPDQIGCFLSKSLQANRENLSLPRFIESHPLRLEISKEHLEVYILKLIEVISDPSIYASLEVETLVNKIKELSQYSCFNDLSPQILGKLLQSISYLPEALEGFFDWFSDHPCIHTLPIETIEASLCTVIDHELINSDDLEVDLEPYLEGIQKQFHFINMSLDRFKALFLKVTEEVSESDQKLLLYQLLSSTKLFHKLSSDEKGELVIASIKFGGLTALIEVTGRHTFFNRTSPQALAQMLAALQIQELKEIIFNSSFNSCPNTPDSMI